MRGRIVLGELLGRKGELAAGGLGKAPVLRVIVGVDNQLAFDRHRLVLRVVEIDPSAKAACRRLAGLRVHRIRPNRDQPRRGLVLRLLDFLVLAGPCQLVRHFFQAAEIHALAAGDESKCQHG